MKFHPSFVLFTDLDGTLLDARTYDPGPSVHALDRCRRLGIPVVMIERAETQAGETVQTVADVMAWLERFPF